MKKDFKICMSVVVAGINDFAVALERMCPEGEFWLHKFIYIRIRKDFALYTRKMME